MIGNIGAFEENTLPVKWCFRTCLLELKPRARRFRFAFTPSIKLWHWDILFASEKMLDFSDICGPKTYHGYYILYCVFIRASWPFPKFMLCVLLATAAILDIARSLGANTVQKYDAVKHSYRLRIGRGFHIVNTCMALRIRYYSNLTP